MQLCTSLHDIVTSYKPATITITTQMVHDTSIWYTQTSMQTICLLAITITITIGDYMYMRVMCDACVIAL